MIRNRSGFGVPATLVAVFLIAAIGVSMLYLVISNQQIRVQQVTGDQAFYSVQAGMEFALGQILEDSSTATSWTRKFSDETISIDRDANKIGISSPDHNAFSEHEIDDPDPPASLDCLVVDSSGAYMSGTTRLRSINLSRDSSCTEPITIYGMSGTTWEPNNGGQINRVRIASNPTEFTGSASSGGVIVFSNNYVINDSSAHLLNDIRWQNENVSNHNFELHFLYTYDGSNYVKIADVNFLADDQADCFSWSTSNAVLDWSSGRWREIEGTTVSNSCDDPINLDKMTVSWVPSSPSRDLNRIYMQQTDGTGGATIFNGSAASGVEIDVDYALLANTTRNVNYFSFSDEILEDARDFTVTWTFADGTSKITSLNMFAPNQNTCLNVDTSSSSIDPSNHRRIIDLTIRNACYSDIGITGLKPTWTGSPSYLTRSRIEDHDGANTYNDNASSGVVQGFGTNDSYLTYSDGVKDVEYLQFNSDVADGTEFTLEFTMADGTTKSVTFTVGIPTEADDLVVSTSSSSVGGGGNRYLYGLTVNNNGSSTITWTSAIVSWSPNGSEKMQRIRVDNSNVWTNWSGLNSGSTADISDVAINASQTLNVNFLRFSTNMTSKAFTIQFIMNDASVKTVGPFSP